MQYAIHSKGFIFIKSYILTSLELFSINTNFKYQNILLILIIRVCKNLSKKENISNIFDFLKYYNLTLTPIEAPVIPQSVKVNAPIVKSSKA